MLMLFQALVVKAVVAVETVAATLRMDHSKMAAAATVEVTKVVLEGIRLIIILRV